jgi:hypothetical protein
MVKTIITPQETNYNLVIPINYIGKKVEILLYAIDELTESKNEEKHVKLSDKYKNVFTKEDAKDFDNFTEKSRKEWEGIY